MLSRRCMPPENCLTGSRARSARPVRSSAQSTCCASSLAGEPLQPAERLEVLARRQQRIERELLRHDAELRRRAAGRRAADRTRESRRQSSRTRPAMARISVVLPAPFGPSSASSSPWRSSNDAPSSASTAPKRFRRVRRQSGRSCAVALRLASRRGWRSPVPANGGGGPAGGGRCPSPEPRAARPSGPVFDPGDLSDRFGADASLPLRSSCARSSCCRCVIRLLGCSLWKLSRRSRRQLPGGDRASHRAARLLAWRQSRNRHCSAEARRCRRTSSRQPRRVSHNCSSRMPGVSISMPPPGSSTS